MTLVAGAGMTASVFAIHENPDWWPPFAAAFEAERLPVEEWLLGDGGELDLDSEPPPGVFWSRMSASSHTRGHGLAKEHTRAVLTWLERHGRRVVNGSGVLELEMSKVAQHQALRAAGIDVPRTVAVVGKDELTAAASRLELPFISKHNQGGKGLGVRRFDALPDFEAYVYGADFEAPVDGITLLQEYVQPAEPFITRVEIVGGEYLYSVRASTEQGFELCPADDCELPEAGTRAMFELRPDYTPPLLDAYLGFMLAHRIEIAGIEFIETAAGRLVTYDVNTNTNYNPEVDARAERSGPREIARFLSRLARA